MEICKDEVEKVGQGHFVTLYLRTELFLKAVEKPLKRVETSTFRKTALFRTKE